MRCCQCQKELPDGVPFCKYCGARQTPQEAGEARKGAPQAETIQPVHQPAASPVVEWEMPRAATAGETEEPPVPLAGKAVSTRAEPEREPEVPPDLAAVGEATAQPEFPLEETVPAEAGEMPGPAAAPVPPTPELRFRVIPEEMEQPAQPEPEDLVFDLDQILQKIASADAAEPKSGETAPSVEKEDPLWFDPDEVRQPAAVVENAEPAPETMPLESNQDVTPEQGEAAAAPAELGVEAGGEPAEPPARESRQWPLMWSCLQRPESRRRLHQNRRQSCLQQSRKRTRQPWQSSPGFIRSRGIPCLWKSAVLNSARSQPRPLD